MQAIHCRFLQISLFGCRTGLARRVARIRCKWHSLCQPSSHLCRSLGQPHLQLKPYAGLCVWVLCSKAVTPARGCVCAALSCSTERPATATTSILAISPVSSISKAGSSCIRLTCNASSCSAHFRYCNKHQICSTHHCTHCSQGQADAECGQIHSSRFAAH